jgi:hypothetical protein
VWCGDPPRGCVRLGHAQDGSLSSEPHLRRDLGHAMGHGVLGRGAPTVVMWLA